jgi:hypothetical protein
MKNRTDVPSILMKRNQPNDGFPVTSPEPFRQGLHTRNRISIKSWCRPDSAAIFIEDGYALYIEDHDDRATRTRGME